jgi:hypothetical protein
LNELIKDRRLSALVEGREIDPTEREALLADLAASEDDYEVFTDTVEILETLEKEDAVATVGWGVAVFRYVGRAAAVLVAIGLIVVPVWLWRASVEREPQQVASRAVFPAQEVADSLIDRDPGGGEYRGGSDAAERNVRAVRAGAMLVNLSVAVQLRDTERTRVLAEQVRARFARDPSAAAAPLRRIWARPDAPPDSLARLLDQAADRLAGRLGRRALELGAWVQAARLAAHGGNEDFFEGGTSRGMLRRAERLFQGDDGVRTAVADVRAALPAQGPPQWQPLRDSLDVLVKELASTA